MPSEQLYVVEMIVKKIELEPGIRITNIDGLTISFKFAQFINFDVDTAYFTSPEIEEQASEINIKMNYGKSFLFIARPSTLRQLLQSEPFKVTLYDGIKSLGTSTVPWKKDFAEMVKYFETLGIVKSTTVEDIYELREKGVLNAKIDIFLRMSCFGQNVQTMFQIKTNDDLQFEYIFRQRNASRTFKVEKHDDERCQPLVGPLYSGIADDTKAASEINVRENISLTQLFERDAMTLKPSVYQPPEADEGIRLDFQEDYDKVSICFRPSENKFYDLLNIISANVKTNETRTEVTFQKKKVNHVDEFLKSVGGNLSDSPNLVIEDDEEDITQMTADRIAQKLCGNKDCPAVKKFKEYGIGPLATGKGLGTVYGDVEPPVTYGMSHTYGTMCEYGPYGVFSRPKQEELPFVPRTNQDEPSGTRPCKIRKETPNCGDSLKENKNKNNPKWHSETCPLCPDRLKGGSDNSDIINPEMSPEKEGTVMPKSPMTECRSVMDQFDSILAEYKKAIGPCGHATCPYAQTLAENTCKKICEDPTIPQSGDQCDGGTKEDAKKNRYPAGCGSPKCAYTKYKLGLLDDDAELELKFLPPALRDNCGDPNCKYPLSPPLPPIHWDCPNPLPNGPCRNLNCPFQPSPLKKFKTKKQLKTGPCGSPMCPYALPQPCGVPTCPFVKITCPMTQENKINKSPPSSEENLCENPDCPFAEKNVDTQLDDEVDDPKFKGEFQDCENEDCPYKQKNDKKKSKKKKKKQSHNLCDNTDCPFAKSKKTKEKKKRMDSDTSVCSNPECPSRAKKNKNTSTSSSSESVCSDPECPYSGLRNQKDKKKEKEATCKNSDASCNKMDEDSVCSNPECPERQARNIDDPNLCNIPDCPYSKKPNKAVPCDDPNCPYLQPLPSCGIPNCPYEPIPLRFSCENPKCPSKSVDFRKSTDKSKCGLDNEAKLAQGSKERENMAIILQTTTVCEDSIPCDAPEECENPDCDMKEGDSGQKQIALSQSKKKGKRKNKGKFVYSIGDTYPSTKLGHKDCVTPMFNVPPHMGWLWNIFTPVLRLKPRRGWRPGALTRTIAARIRAHRQSKGLGYLKVPDFKKDGTQFDEGDVKVVPKPTLQIQKKEGAYWITMNPLKDPNSLVENEDPYMECTPMTFKITKNKKPQEQYCYCDGEDPPNDSLSSSSDSELDIEFTPPAGIIHPERFKKRPNVACCEAQYDPTDFEVAKKKDNKKGKGKGKEKGAKAGKKGKAGKKK